MTIEGIDVSVFQGAVDWPAVAAGGVQFTICRATVGLGTDASFLTNIRGARAAGLLVGAYHAYETSHDPVAQAKHFGAVAGGLVDLCPFLDFEGGCVGLAPGAGLGMAQRFCETADALFTKTCGLYSFPFFWNGLVTAMPTAAEWCTSRPFWLALYPGKPNPSPLKPFSSVGIHQYSGSSKDVAGVHTTCDRDRVYGPLEALRALGVRAPPPDAPIVPDDDRPVFIFPDLDDVKPPPDAA